MSEDIEELKRRRMQQLMQQQMQQQQQQAMQEQMQEAEISKQIKFIIREILTPEARQRLENIRLVRPQYARQIEVLLIQLKQANKLPQTLNDEAFKEVLKKLKEGQRESKVSFKKE